MTFAPHSWLPQNALLDGVLGKQFEEKVQTWGNRWFPLSGKTSFRASSGKMSLPKGATCWESSCRGLGIAVDRPAQMRLAGAMLGMKQAVSKSTRADLKLLDGLIAVSVEDLIRSVADVFHTQPDPKLAERSRFPDGTIDAALQFSVSGSVGRLFEFYVGWDAATAARKSLIWERRTPIALGSRRDAIGRQTVHIGAHIGDGQIDLSELRSLAPGDVLVLDRSTEDRLELTINGSRAPRTSYELRRDGPVLKLQIGKLERGAVT